MNYDMDTLESAKNNREASQRFYHQMMQPRCFITPQELPMMLHRSPSGAKRKIRQRREEGGPRPSPFLSPSSSSVTSSTSVTSSHSVTSYSSREVTSSSVNSSPVPDDSNYRSLVDSGSYQSILPDYDYTPPKPAPRLNSSLSSSMSSLDVSSTSSSTLPSAFSKPTVEVHPMPLDERSMSREDIVVIKKEKPAVPAKPKGLLIDHLNRSTSMCSLAPSTVSMTSSVFLNNLCASPSLLSVQKTYKNVDREEIEKHDERRYEPSFVSRRINTFDDEKEVVHMDFNENERIGRNILDMVQMHDPLLAGRVRRHIENNRELMKLETQLRNQMDKIVHHLRSTGGDQNDALQEEAWLRRRLNDAQVLRTTYQRRERELDNALTDILNDQQFRVWQNYQERDANIIRESSVKGEERCSTTDSGFSFRSFQSNRQMV